LNIVVKGGKDIRFIPLLITKKEYETINETIIRGILIPCPLSEIYNLEMKKRDEINKYANKILLSEGISFSTILKIMIAFYRKIHFDGCNDTKNYTLTFKFSDNFDKKELTLMKLMITKILPEQEYYRNGKIECIEKKMKC